MRNYPSIGMHLWIKDCSTVSEATIDRNLHRDGIFPFDPVDGFENLLELREEMGKEGAFVRGGQALLEEQKVLVKSLSSVTWRFGRYYSYSGLVVAFTTGYLTETNVFRVVELFVSPPFRRLGIGDELLTEMLALSRSLGALTLETVVLPGSAASKSLMESHGLKARAIVMSRESLL